MPNLQLANNLQYLRKSRKFTQKDLSTQLNISRQAYSNYETLKRMPDLDSLLRLSVLYRVNLDDLVLRDLQSLERSARAYSERISEGRLPYTHSVNKNTGKSIYITEEELETLTMFRSLSPENKSILTGFLKTNMVKKN